jgi:hypothetical protein
MKKGGNDTNNKPEQKPHINLNKPASPKTTKERIIKKSRRKAKTINA